MRFSMTEESLQN